ncbi:hypothetical protein SOJ48_18245 [Pseudomonas aeruginosa]|uniref:hypothetical protein n=1 Tax=Pseudomonas aeruginosa group TaxID=136841 RepID=UPI000B1BC5CD|nr:hypothetical protein [Pseudomonas aeruginosa]MDY1338850.1 hypothetical protein [Pseudomonas aeruginosa]MEA8481068.1 hypothetical protein [Pseudomonas aeruginosa]
MTFKISKAAIIDDSLGAPAAGTVESEDKNSWLDFLLEQEEAQKKLLELFAELECADLGELFTEITSKHEHLSLLWEMSGKVDLSDVLGLELLFKAERLNRIGKSEKAELVTSVLRRIVDDPNCVQQFADIQSAAEFLSGADIAFVDFFMSDNESEAQAVARIKSSASILSRAKLVFFMSSRASIEMQQQVREILGIRTAFFEVMTKSQINEGFVEARIQHKAKAFDGNWALQNVIAGLMTAAQEAALEFEHQSKTLEIHDLQFLELFRLNAENQTLPEYLTWLFSEALAAKTRRLGLPKVASSTIRSDEATFTGDILQKKVLYDFFSEIVFSPACSNDGARFGDILKSEDGRYLLVLTPACDLIRCEAHKNILCVEAKVQDYSDPRNQSKEKLFGKHDAGLRHLLKVGAGESERSLLLTWQKDSIHTFKYSELCGKAFERVGLMNEIFAHEVKEEVLRNLGRVGTSINPAPPFALNAVIRWRLNGETYVKETPAGDFISAVLTYSEQMKGTERKLSPTVVLSDKFKDWVNRQISEGSAALDIQIDAKLSRCLTTLNEPQFSLNGSHSYRDNDFILRVDSAVPVDELSSRILLEVSLLVESIDG